MNMNLHAPAPVLLGESLIDLLRSLPGYDFVSRAGGRALSLITSGNFSPETQANLMAYLDMVTQMTGKKREDVTPADLERYADLYQGRSGTNPWVIGGLGLGALAIVIALMKKK